QRADDKRGIDQRVIVRGGRDEAPLVPPVAERFDEHEPDQRDEPEPGAPDASREREEQPGEACGDRHQRLIRNARQAASPPSSGPSSLTVGIADRKNLRIASPGALIAASPPWHVVAALQRPERVCSAALSTFCYARACPWPARCSWISTERWSIRSRASSQAASPPCVCSDTIQARRSI